VDVRELAAFCGLEIRDTADLEVCATESPAGGQRLDNQMRPPRPTGALRLAFAFDLTTLGGL